MMPVSEEQEPTRDQLLAMAYSDGELADDARLEFEARLAREPALLQEVSELKGLEVLARRVAPREPGDFVRERLEKEPLHSGLTYFAFSALVVASVFGLVLLCWGLAVTDDLNTGVKALIGLAAAGLAVLFLLTLRQRLLLLPHDPYRSVER